MDYRTILGNLYLSDIGIRNQIFYKVKNCKRKITYYSFFMIVYKYLTKNKIKRTKMLLELSKNYGDRTYKRLKRAIYRIPKRKYVKYKGEDNEQIHESIGNKNNV